MRKLRFSIERSVVGGLTDAALIDAGTEDATDDLVRQVMDDISTDLQVTVGGVTMFLAAWQDPDHWATDWAEQLDVEREDVPDAIAALLKSATIEDRA